MDYQEALEEAGTFGKAQFTNIVMIYLFNIYIGWQTIVPVFTATQVPFYCADSSTTSMNSTLYDKACIDDCQLYIYKQNIKSIIAEFNLACGSYQIMSSISNSAFWFPAMFSSVLMGAATDRFGRKPTFLFNTALHISCSTVTAFSQNIWFYTVFRFLAGFFYGGVAGPLFLILTETVKRDYLAQLITGALAIFASGEIIGAFIGYILQSSWRLQIIAVSVAPIPILAAFAFLVPESPMWLHSKKRYREAGKVLRQLALRNGKDPSMIILADDEFGSLSKVLDQSNAIGKLSHELKTLEVKVTTNSNEENASFLDLFRTFPAFMLSVGQISSWFTAALVYYGSIFSVGGVSGDPYANSTLLAACEIPVWLVCFAMDKFGRKISCYVCLIVSSLTCLVLPFAKPLAGSTFQLVCAIAGKCMARAAFFVTHTYTPELFPTVLRGSALLLCYGASTTAIVLAPFVTALNYGVYNCTPYIIFAFCGLASSLFIMVYGHETLGKPLLNSKEEFYVAAGQPRKVSKIDEDALKRLYSDKS